MKQILKQLAARINAVINANEVANEMGALVDYGEWSQTEPDLTGVVEKWGLTKNMVDGYIAIAERWAKQFWQHRPIIEQTAKQVYRHGPYLYNPWEDVSYTLACLHMAKNLK